MCALIIMMQTLSTPARHTSCSHHLTLCLPVVAGVSFAHPYVVTPCWCAHCHTRARQMVMFAKSQVACRCL